MASTWSGNSRADGLIVLKCMDGWAIIPEGEGAEPVLACPFCFRSITSAEAAKRIADGAFPLEVPA